VEVGLRCRRGGIRGLLELIRQHREALEYDLIALGLRLDWLGTRRLTWRDLWVVVSQSPKGSAVHRAQAPGEWEWDLQADLTAGVFDALQIANWQRGRARRSEFPKPLPRPGVEPDSQTIGSGVGIPMDEMAKRLGWTEAVAPPERKRLDADQVREIRSLAGSMPNAEIATQFNVSHRTVADVIARRSWKNVE
jgi:hypothetical protein